MQTQHAAAQRYPSCLGPDITCGTCAGRESQSIEAAEAAGLAHERDASIALLHSDADRREFISAGAAAGLAVCMRCLSARTLYLIHVCGHATLQWSKPGLAHYQVLAGSVVGHEARK